MACETCVDMTLRMDALVQENMRLKVTNRVMRQVNGVLRRDVKNLREGADMLFLLGCEVDKSAELALEELWSSEMFECGPQDYEHIVKRCLAAIREYNESRNDPEQDGV